jgi:Na+-transporting NADH:ubiquinone oxidoreductase subunit NqrC
MSSEKSLSEELIIATVQTLVFGVLLAGLGYWLNLRLEGQKQAFADQSEKTKAVISLLEPLAQERRMAYLEFRNAARGAVTELDVIYSRAPEAGSTDDELNRFNSLENRMGIGSGGTGMGGWTTKGYAAGAVHQLIVLRAKYEGVASDNIERAVRDFIEVLMKDLNDNEIKENNTKSFHDAASAHAHDALDKLDDSLAEALHLDHLPMN